MLFSFSPAALDLDAIDSGRLKLEMAPCSIVAEVHAMATLLLPNAVARGLSLRFGCTLSATPAHASWLRSLWQETGAANAAAAALASGPSSFLIEGDGTRPGTGSAGAATQKPVPWRSNTASSATLGRGGPSAASPGVSAGILPTSSGGILALAAVPEHDIALGVGGGGFDPHSPWSDATWPADHSVSDPRGIMAASASGSPASGLGTRQRPAPSASAPPAMPTIMVQAARFRIRSIVTNLVR